MPYYLWSPSEKHLFLNYGLQGFSFCPFFG
jgi:hypothetical protein